ncbi:hypothetical protein B0H14DRAFT_2766153 [Mycena olivaceomarginata]|nr:hypothetical protein B0H14DRAFT_2766153 [Mycena olivaceomarginata]
MSHRQTRKRRRSQAFPDEDGTVLEDGAAKYVESTGQDRLDKEREVWDAFKDEHVEVFDLSSILRRRFHLVRELDQHDAQNTASLLEAFTKYVQFRRASAQPPSAVVPSPAESNPPENPTAEATNNIVDSQSETLDDSAPSMQDPPPVPAADSTTASDEPLPPPNGSLNIPPATSSQSAPAPVNPPSGREMLAIIAKLSEASIRDREEKVNLTLSVCDSSRSMPISLGARSGTRLAPILLPELVVPRWTKPARATLRKAKKGRKKDPPPTEAAVPPPRPKPPVIPNADPNESRYCYCDQVSFGEMIACDDPRCEREWFHLTCTALAAAPEGRKKWFCDDCVLRKKKKEINKMCCT